MRARARPRERTQVHACAHTHTHTHTRTYDWGRRGRERGKKRILSRLPAISTEPNAEIDPTNHEIMT